MLELASFILSVKCIGTGRDASESRSSRADASAAADVGVETIIAAPVPYTSSTVSHLSVELCQTDGNQGVEYFIV